jgi:hypothetical protein
MIQEKTAESWEQLQKLLFEESWNPLLGRFRSPSAFRGLNNSDYKLESTFIRLHQDKPKLENHLLRNFKKYSQTNIVEKDSLWYWLAIAQHHGLPTRLLDWSYSPFVAMHFATSHIEDFGKDGAIWSIDFERAHQLLPPKLKDALYSEGANMFTAEILSSCLDALEDFDGMSDSPLVLMFEPPSMNSQRITNQYAIFSMMSNALESMEAWIDKHPDLCKKIIIPMTLKWEIRDKLDQANITERLLFPGMDGLALWLKRHYSSATKTN